MVAATAETPAAAEPTEPAIVEAEVVTEEAKEGGASKGEDYADMPLEDRAFAILKDLGMAGSTEEK